MSCHSLKIWILLDSSLSGGIESHVFQLAHGLKRFKHEPVVVFLKNWGSHSIFTLLTNMNISYRILDGSFSCFKSTLLKDDPELIHTHGYKAGIVGRIYGFIFKVPVVSTFHAGESLRGKLWLYDFIDRKSAFMCNKVFAVSHTISSKVVNNCTVINNFVAFDNLAFCNGDKLAYVGRLTYTKGVDRLIDLASAFNNIDINVYGSGEMESVLKSFELKNLIFHGEQLDLDPIWSEIGVIVIPSRREGLPMVALEAMARGVLVISTRVGDLERLITDGVNGWLIDEDKIDLLPKKVDEYYRCDQAKLINMRLNARHTVLEHYSSNSVIPNIVQYYMEAVRSANS